MQSMLIIVIYAKNNIVTKTQKIVQGGNNACLMSTGIY